MNPKNQLNTNASQTAIEQLEREIAILTSQLNYCQELAKYATAHPHMDSDAIAKETLTLEKKLQDLQQQLLRLTPPQQGEI